MKNPKKDHPVFETHPGGHKGNPHDHDVPAEVPEPSTMILLLIGLLLLLLGARVKRRVSETAKQPNS